MLLALQVRDGGGSYWQIIVILGGVIAAMALFTVKREMSRGRAIGKVKDECAAEVKQMYRDQLKELKDHRDLVGTLIERIDRKRKGG
jgi:hypothetical protein